MTPSNERAVARTHRSSSYESNEIGASSVHTLHLRSSRLRENSSPPLRRAAVEPSLSSRHHCDLLRRAADGASEYNRNSTSPSRGVTLEIRAAQADKRDVHYTGRTRDQIDPTRRPCQAIVRPYNRLRAAFYNPLLLRDKTLQSIEQAATCCTCRQVHPK